MRGARLLVCPPDHFRVAYEINPWMHREVPVDPDRARLQWDALVTTLRAAGAEVVEAPARPGLPDMVFAANAGLVNHGRVVPSRFRHPERRGETDHWRRWFAAAGLAVHELADGHVHEGAGDALPAGDGFLSAYRQRSDAAAHLDLSRALGAAVRPVELADPRYYHLDLCLCPLDERRALVVPGAFDDYGRRVVEAVVPERLVLDDDAARAFVANSVVVGTTVVMPHCPVAVGRRLEAWGFEVAVVEVGEFEKAGGACRCLTLDLGVAVGPSPGNGNGGVGGGGGNGNGNGDGGGDDDRGNDRVGDDDRGGVGGGDNDRVGVGGNDRVGVGGGGGGGDGDR